MENQFTLDFQGWEINFIRAQVRAPRLSHEEIVAPAQVLRPVPVRERVHGVQRVRVPPEPAEDLLAHGGVGSLDDAPEAVVVPGGTRASVAVIPPVPLVDAPRLETPQPPAL